MAMLCTGLGLELVVSVGVRTIIRFRTRAKFSITVRVIAMARVCVRIGVLIITMVRSRGMLCYVMLLLL